MKRLTIFLVSVLFALNIAAQKDEKHDVILKINGEELSGKITEISDTEVKFVYTGETLVYAIKKSDILKITYASGRVEIINKPALPSEGTNVAPPDPKAAASLNVNPVDHHNKVAIMPFSFISDNQSAAEEMKYKVQTECYTYMSKHAGELTIIDPRTTNALLIKAGITRETVMGFTMEEICNVIGAEYIIDGTITVNRGTQTSTQSGNYKTTDGYNDKSGKYDSKSTGSSTSSSIQSYQTSIAMTIYTDKNTTIFNEDHKSFWTSADAYKTTLQYLIKKSPLYRK